MVEMISLNCLQVSLGENQSFEYLAVNLQFDISVLLLIMYRPPKYNSEFMSDSADLLSNICIDSTASTTVCFNELLQLFDLSQHVKEPTHQQRHILDLVISMGTDNAVNDVTLLDHYCVFFSALLAADRAITRGHVKKRYFCKTSLQSFQTHFLSAKSSLLFKHFSVDSRDLTDAINLLKSSTSPFDPLPASFFKCFFFNFI